MEDFSLLYFTVFEHILPFIPVKHLNVLQGAERKLRDEEKKQLRKRMKGKNIFFSSSVWISNEILMHRNNVIELNLKSSETRLQSTVQEIRKLNSARQKTAKPGKCNQTTSNLYLEWLPGNRC